MGDTDPTRDAGSPADESTSHDDTVEFQDSVPSRPAPSAEFSIEGYQILRELHRGGQGVVYEALELSTKRNVAVKLLLGGAHASPVAQKRFEREIELVAQLGHANIISIFSSGKTRDGLTYYAMDYVRGKPLNEYVRDERLTLEDSFRLVATVCDAVQYAHQRGVIHRDLKPSNVLVDSDGIAKVLDFGLAKLMTGADETALSVTDQVMGTLRYMSPEQASGKIDEIDTRTDVYSLGVMLYEVLTGRFPYPADGQLTDVLTHIMETPPKPAAAQWSSDSGITDRSNKKLRAGQCPIDQDAQTIVMKSLAKERERRYQSSGELARDLERYVAGEAIEARRDSAVYVVRTTLRQFARRNQLLLGLGLAAVVAVAGGFALISYKAARDRELGRTQREAKADVMVREAVALQRDGDLEGAETRLEESLLFDPENFQALGNLAIVKKDAHFRAPYVEGAVDRLEESNVLCERALALEPNNPGLWNVKCVALYSIGRYDEAEQACRRALEIDPTYFWAHSNMAKVLALEGRLDQALASADSAVEAARRRGSEKDTWATGPWRTLGTLQMMLGDAAAGKSFEHALECNSSDAWTRASVALLHLDDDSAKALRNAIVANEVATTEDARINQVVARAALADGALDDAVRSAAECVRLDPGMTACHLVLAIAKAGETGPKAGREHFEDALATFGAEKDRELQIDARRGVLWFQRGRELNALCEEAATAVGVRCERRSP